MTEAMGVFIVVVFVAFILFTAWVKYQIWRCKP